jgi:hypothetical protein
MLALLVTLGFGTAFGDDPVVSAADASSDVPPEAAAAAATARAEYVRLQQELEKLSARNAWSGVERTYTALVATGLPPTFQDHLFGAHSARSMGDVTSARARLLAANALREDREVLDWLWEIDSNYGLVYLAADPGTANLVADVMPFEPDQSQAVLFAQQQVTDTGTFEGYLPQGKYTFCGSEVRVQPRVQAVRIDFRTDAGVKSQRKKEKK